MDGWRRTLSYKVIKIRDVCSQFWTATFRIFFEDIIWILHQEVFNLKILFENFIIKFSKYRGPSPNRCASQNRCARQNRRAIQNRRAVKPGVPVKTGVLEDRVAPFWLLTFHLMLFRYFGKIFYAFTLKTCKLSNVNTSSLSFVFLIGHLYIWPCIGSFEPHLWIKN